jgi:hypothetical protein
MAGELEILRERGADEAGGACYQDFHWVPMLVAENPGW